MVQERRWREQIPIYNNIWFLFFFFITIAALVERVSFLFQRKREPHNDTHPLWSSLLRERLWKCSVVQIEDLRRLLTGIKFP